MEENTNHSKSANAIKLTPQTGEAEPTIVNTDSKPGRQWKITSEEYEDENCEKDHENCYDDFDIEGSDEQSQENSQNISTNSGNDEESSIEKSKENSDNSEEDVDFGMENYFFSQDFLPERYDRQSQSQYAIQFVSGIQILINLLLLTGFCILAINKSIVLTNSHAADIAILSLFYASIFFWFNYKLHELLLNISRLFVNLELIKRNDKYYSGVEIPDFFIQSKEYPPVTLQIPINDEHFENVIKPTLIQCVQESVRYTVESGSKCNVLVCDDGYNQLSDEEKHSRLQFYTENNIGFIARPHPDKLPRLEKCRKAGNLNFAMNFTSKWLVAENVSITSSPSTDATSISSHMGTLSIEQYEAYQKNRDHLISLGTVFHGDTDIGEFILLLNPDSRLPDLPNDENGCVKRLVKEMLFDGEDVLYLQCFTSPYLRSKTGAEKSVFHHTSSMYNSIMMGTAARMIPTLLDHNVLLSKNALVRCAMSTCVDKDTSMTGGITNNSQAVYLKKYFSEDRSFEDVDLMMRGYSRGLIGRYVSYAGTFQESVSQTYLSEYLKIGRYAASAAEFLYNPISNWRRNGIISPALLAMFRSKKIEWYNKLSIVSLIVVFMTISAIHWAVLSNLIFCDVIIRTVPCPLLPVNLMWGSIFLSVFVGPILNFMFGVRMNFNKWVYFKQTLRETVFTTCLYGSISVRMSFAFFAQFFGYTMNHTVGSDTDRSLVTVQWLQSTYSEGIVYLLYAVAIAIRLVIFTAPQDRAFVGYYGCLPIVWNIFLFCAGPLLFDILPSNEDKSSQKSFNPDTRQFDDKYRTHLPESIHAKSFNAQSKTSLYPDALSTEIGTDDGSSVAGSEYSARDSTWGWPGQQSNLPPIPEGQEVSQV